MLRGCVERPIAPTATPAPSPGDRRAATDLLVVAQPPEVSDDQTRIRANYKGNYDRQVEVKRRYDPDNLFHVNQNIRP